jgi:hypothetical protein
MELAFGIGGSIALSLVSQLPGRAAGEPVTGLNLGCASGYAMVNVRPASGSNPSTNLVGLTINGGSNQPVPSACTITPSGTPAVSGDGNVLLGGNSTFTRNSNPRDNTVPGSPQLPRFYITNDVTIPTNGNNGLSNTTVVNDLWASRAATDAQKVSEYIKNFSGNGACSGINLTYCQYNTVSYNDNSSQTITGISGLNFYDVSSFGNNVQLNFQGDSNDFFVFNVAASSVVTNRGWTIDGLDPSQIIFNLIGNTSNNNTNGNTAAGLILNSGANVLGTFLVSSNNNAACASNGNNCNGGTVRIGSNASLYGSLIVINNANEQVISFGSNSVINGKPFNPTRLRRVPGPLPVLGGLAAFGWSRRIRRRLKLQKVATDA